MCLHETIVERMCDACGQIVEPSIMVRTWTSQSVTNKSTLANAQMFAKLLSSGCEATQIRHAYDCVKTISTLKKSMLKGKRKRALVFAALFAQKPHGDPDILRAKLKLSRVDCNRALEMYETHLNPIAHDWSMLLRSKLLSINMSDLYTHVCDEMLLSNNRTKIAQQLVSCIAHVCKQQERNCNEQLLRTTFGVDKIKKFSRVKRV